MDVLKMEALVLRIEPSSVIYVSAGNGEKRVLAAAVMGNNGNSNKVSRPNGTGMAGLYDFMRRLGGGLRQSESIVQFRALVAYHRRV